MEKWEETLSGTQWFWLSRALPIQQLSHFSQLPGEGVPGAQPLPSADVGAAVGGKAAHTDLLEPIKFAEILQTSC